VVHYAATQLPAGDLRHRICGWLVEAGVARTTLPDGVEVVHRDGDGASFAFLLNHTSEAVVVDEGGVDLATSDTHQGSVALAAGAALVLRQEPVSR
jgi:beta-galactosidase